MNKQTIMNSEVVDERLFSLRMRGKFNNFIIISVHTLIEEKYDLLRNPFMINLLRYIKEFQHITNIAVGDFNARIGREGLKTNYREKEAARDIK